MLFIYYLRARCTSDSKRSKAAYKLRSACAIAFLFPHSQTNRTRRIPRQDDKHHYEQGKHNNWNQRLPAATTTANHQTRLRLLSEHPLEPPSEHSLIRAKDIGSMQAHPSRTSRHLEPSNEAHVPIRQSTRIHRTEQTHLDPSEPIGRKTRQPDS
nr:hypothetical protein Q903MT_gene4599 [Picea sitchensis]